MSYIQDNTLPEVAAYGRGLGDSLGQAMYAVPQQRAQIAMQLAQAQAQQQQAMLEYALRQQGQQQQAQYQQGELGVQQGELDQHKLDAVARAQELVQADEIHRINAEAAKTRAMNEAKGTWKLGETKAGKPYKINTLTGDISWLPTEEPGAPGAGPINVASPQMKALGEMFNGYNRTAQAGIKYPEIQNPTNASYPQFSYATNMLAQITPLILGRLAQTQTNQQAAPTVPPTNTAPVPQLGGMAYPAGSTPPPWQAAPPVQQAVPYDQWLKQ